MKYDGRLSGFGVTLRCATESDAELMYRIRTLPSALGRVGDPPVSVEAQRQWIGKVLDRAGDYCFIVEQEGLGPVGTVSLIVKDDGSAEPGRWIIQPGSLAAVASSLWIYTFAMETLGCDRIVLCVESGNQPVLSYHRRYGAPQVRIEKHARLIQGTWRDLVWFELKRSDWPRVREFFRRQAGLAHSLMQRTAEAGG